MRPYQSFFTTLFLTAVYSGGCKFITCGDDTETFTDSVADVYVSDIDRILMNYDGNSADLECADFCRFVVYASEKIDSIDGCSDTVDLSAYDPNSETDADSLLGSVTCSGVIGEMCH